MSDPMTLDETMNLESETVPATEARDLVRAIRAEMNATITELRSALTRAEEACKAKDNRIDDDTATINRLRVELHRADSAAFASMAESERLSSELQAEKTRGDAAELRVAELHRAVDRRNGVVEAARAWRKVYSSCNSMTEYVDRGLDVRHALLDALRALDATAEAKPTAEEDEEPSPEACQRCGNPYALRPGDEPTRYCDPCAHEAVEELRSALARAEEEKAALRNECDRRMDALERSLIAAQSELQVDKAQLVREKKRGQFDYEQAEQARCERDDLREQLQAEKARALANAEACERNREDAHQLAKQLSTIAERTARAQREACSRFLLMEHPDNSPSSTYQDWILETPLVTLTSLHESESSEREGEPPCRRCGEPREKHHGCGGYCAPFTPAEPATEGKCTCGYAIGDDLDCPAHSYSKQPDPAPAKSDEPKSEAIDEPNCNTGPFGPRAFTTAVCALFFPDDEYCGDDYSDRLAQIKARIASDAATIAGLREEKEALRLALVKRGMWHDGDGITCPVCEFEWDVCHREHHSKDCIAAPQKGPVE